MTFRQRAFLFLLAPLLFGCSEEKRQTTGDEILVWVDRVAASKAKTPEDILPYDEALVWHEYNVKKVTEGELQAGIIRVAHWSVVSGKAVEVDDEIGKRVRLKIRPFEKMTELQQVASSDDLDVTVDAPRFIDVTPTNAVATTPEGMRLDYRGHFSEQMALYWKLRPQLKLVIMGNSHATKGVCPNMFFPEDNETTPVVLNMAPAGANNDMQCLLMKEYISQLPQLKWVVWVVSARSYNKARLDDRKMQEFLESPGWKYDQQHKTELWPVPASPSLVTVQNLAGLNIDNFDLWGWEGRRKTNLPEDPVELRKMVMDELNSTRFTWADDKFSELRDSVRELNEKGIRVLLMTTPMHPMSLEAPAVDPDGTTHEGQKEMVDHMAELDKELPLTWFHDFNQAGHHDFPGEDFYDVDHLRRSGSRKLTAKIIEWMRGLEGAGVPVVPAPGGGSAAMPVAPAEKQGRN